MDSEVERLTKELKKAHDKIILLERKIAGLEKNTNLTKDGKPKKKPGPKKNSTTQIEQDVFSFSVLDVNIFKDHLVLSIGESKEYCDFGFIINKNQYKYIKFNENELLITNTIVDSIKY